MSQNRAVPAVDPAEEVLWDPLISGNSAEWQEWQEMAVTLFLVELGGLIEEVFQGWE